MNAIKKMPYTHIHTSTHRLIQSILQIDRLPNIPAHNWTAKAAQALSPLHPGTTFGVAVIHLYATSNRFEIESSDIHPPAHPPAPPAPQSPYSTNPDDARDALSRLGAYPVHIPKELRHLGYIAPISQLYPLWSASKAGTPWTATSPHQTLTGYAPVQTQQIDNNNQPNTQLNQSPQTILGILAFARPNEVTDTPINPAHFSAALSTMAYRAAAAFGTHQSTPIPWLTQREQTILDLLAEGLSVREIAKNIERSHHTVHDHVKNLHKKIGASSRGELISMMLGNGNQHTPPHLISPIIDPLLTQQNNADPTNINTEIKLTPLPHPA